MRSKFGFTYRQYLRMVDEQNGVCRICGNPPPDGERLAVDHDHGCCSGQKTCGQCIRGLLCKRCNSALGLFDDNPETLAAARAYVLAARAEPYDRSEISR
ncbi:Recombination endonuclease VII [Micromonospora matsumotoense]|uniref:Recombination endonuclease VII n=2 Tax=Micromonospora matsumotoense TaxID=121616 RepID=A0A1C4TVM9_9ACTN|nr:Recombination endonuclease VII [Micromonospora matsumotoense]